MHKAYLTIAAFAATFALGACDKPAAPPAPPPPKVSVLDITSGPVALRYQYAGRIAAFREVEVRARVAGILQQKLFVEGAQVREGDVLFRIDPETYDAALMSARAQLKEAEATISRTKRDAERATTLLQRQVGTEKARDDAVSAHELALASVDGAAARVKSAEINLSYTTITAPIPGVISTRVMAEGSLVGTGADNSLLTRITQLDPIYLNFSFSDLEASEIRRLLENGQGLGPTDGKLKVKISFGDGTAYANEGYVDFTDSNLDLQTGTLRARAIVPNPDSKLRPGQFVRVSVEGVTLREAIVIPQATVMQGAQGQYVYTVDADNKAAMRPVTIGREVADGWIVEKGLKAGDRIVREGLVKVRAGSAVNIDTASSANTKAAQ
jgi:membrane fusion protein (multidrug efflux system)